MEGTYLTGVRLRNTSHLCPFLMQCEPVIGRNVIANFWGLMHAILSLIESSGSTYIRNGQLFGMALF